MSGEQNTYTRNHCRGHVQYARSGGQRNGLGVRQNRLVFVTHVHTHSRLSRERGQLSCVRNVRSPYVACIRLSSSVGLASVCEVGSSVSSYRVPLQLAKDLLHPIPDDERRKHKLKRLVQSPNSYFMDVKCPG